MNPRVPTSVTALLGAGLLLSNLGCMDWYFDSHGEVDGCRVGDTTYARGTVFPLDDGCNGCFCNEAGELECTAMYCGADAAPPTCAGDAAPGSCIDASPPPGFLDAGPPPGVDGSGPAPVPDAGPPSAVDAGPPPWLPDAGSDWPDPTDLCADPGGACCRACELVSRCTGDLADMATCDERCNSSLYHEATGVHCLAMRIFWIDEEGCAGILPAYDDFDPADDCTGSPP